MEWDSEPRVRLIRSSGRQVMVLSSDGVGEGGGSYIWVVVLVVVVGESRVMVYVNWSDL